MNRADDSRAYGPADLIAVYNDPPQPAAHVVARFARAVPAADEDRETCANYLRQWPDGPQLSA